MQRIRVYVAVVSLFATLGAAGSAIAAKQGRTMARPPVTRRAPCRS